MAQTRGRVTRVASPFVRVAVLDSGPILAALNRRDDGHELCKEFFAGFQGRLLLPTTVLAEVCVNLEDRPDIEASFLASVNRGAFRRACVEDGDIARMRELVLKYADFPLGGIDASVIAVAERLHITDVATLDHRHFRAVQPRHVGAFTLLP